MAGTLVGAEMRGDNLWVQINPPSGGDSFFAYFDSQWSAQLSGLNTGTRISFDAMLSEGTPPELTDATLL
ncbi:hypothetical protein [Phenylobacterium sp.]|uniref:hypothetical protein n=1 Tax=Phenylobacterium sp. TaxID=1871053 RepID=UPI0030F42EC0